MSDVTINPAAPPSNAPSAPAAPAQAPAGNEVAINENPTASPTPVGSQAPEKAPGRPETRRESIQKAFDRAKAPDAPAKPRPRPGIGHNQPPEETKPEQQERIQERLDLRQPPPRGEGGRFARAPEQGAQTAQTAQSVPGVRPGQPQPRQVAPLPETAPYREPPPRMSDYAKAEWPAAPESVRGDVHRMMSEFAGAYQRFRADHEEMNTIRHFQQMAAEHGTTLQRALTNYVGMEQKLRQDVVGGLDVIINNLNLRTSDGHKINLRDVAYHILNQSPDQHRLIQNSNAQQAAQHQIGSLHQEIADLKGELQQLHYQQAFRETRGGVDAFAETHPRFDELGAVIEQELKFGYTLEEAYARAERLYPAQGSAHAAQPRSTPVQNRSNRSISGAPDTGLSDSPRRTAKKVERRDAIQNAIRRVNGGV